MADLLSASLVTFARSIYSRGLHFLHRYTPIFLTIGLVLCVETLVTVEWSFPYCSNQADGPVYAATGMPLAYQIQSGASSLAYDFMPHVYLLNLAILCVLMFPIIYSVVNFVAPFEKKRRRIMGGMIGLALFFCVTALNFFMIRDDVLRPVFSIADSYTHYKQFRPMGFRFKSEISQCKPSLYWFPESKNNH